MGLFSKKKKEPIEETIVEVPKPSGDEVGRYKTLVEACNVASKYCSKWVFKGDTSEIYDASALIGMAKINDEDYQLDDDGYYVVLSDGSIGEKFEYDTDWLFTPIR